VTIVDVIRDGMHIETLHLTVISKPEPVEVYCNLKIRERCEQRSNNAGVDFGESRE
jgi:hypothetical protein